MMKLYDIVGRLGIAVLAIGLATTSLCDDKRKAKSNVAQLGNGPEVFTIRLCGSGLFGSAHSCGGPLDVE